jgi:hypothetical protein
MNIYIKIQLYYSNMNILSYNRLLTFFINKAKNRASNFPYHYGDNLRNKLNGKLFKDRFLNIFCSN